MRKRFILLVFLATYPLSAAAASDEDDALAIADRTENKVEPTQDWQLFAETAIGQTSLRRDNGIQNSQRVSVDFILQKSLTPDLKLVFSDRYDHSNNSATGSDSNINSLREAYISWRAPNNQFFEIGRVNVRNGVATGYNPTDFFKVGAARSIVSVDPASLRNNRLGAVILKSQSLWSNGSFSAIYSPKITNQISTNPFNPDFGATNFEDRWLLSGSYKIGETLNPQLLLYDDKSSDLVTGLNVTGVLGNATVIYLEWAGGRRRPYIARAGAEPGLTQFSSQFSTGLTYTFENKLSLTLEYQYNGLGLDKREWEALRGGSGSQYVRYRNTVRTSQDLPTKHSILMLGTWQDAFINRVDLTGMIRWDYLDRSSLTWAEVRYRADSSDFALQLQLNSGAARSTYGASEQQRNVQFLLRYYF